MFLLVPAYPGCPGQTAVKWSWLLLLLSEQCLQPWRWRGCIALQQTYKQSLVNFTHTRARARVFHGPLSGTTQVSRYQKVKPIWILLKQETVSGSGISWAICKFTPRFRQIIMPAPHHSIFLQARCKDRSQHKLTKLSNNINVFVIFRRSFMLVIFETIAETTQEIL